MKKILCIILILMLTIIPIYAEAIEEDTASINETQVDSLDDHIDTAIGENNFICEIFGEDVQFEKQLSTIIGLIITVMQILAPVLLVIFGLMDVVKSVAAQKEDDIKKSQQIFIKRTIAAVMVFFVIAIVKFGISLFAKGSEGGIMSCVQCFIKKPDGNRC